MPKDKIKKVIYSASLSAYGNQTHYKKKQGSRISTPLRCVESQRGRLNLHSFSRHVNSQPEDDFLGAVISDGVAERQLGRLGQRNLQ